MDYLSACVFFCACMKDAQEWQARSRLASIWAQPRYFKGSVYWYLLCFLKKISNLLQIRVMVVGLGAGLLPMFIHNHLPVHHIQVPQLTGLWNYTFAVNYLLCCMELIYRTLIATFCSCCLCSFLDSYLDSSFLDFFDSCSLLLLYLFFLHPVSCVIAAVVFIIF